MILFLYIIKIVKILLFFLLYHFFAFLILSSYKIIPISQNNCAALFSETSIKKSNLYFSFIFIPFSYVTSRLYKKLDKVITYSSSSISILFPTKTIFISELLEFLHCLTNCLIESSHFLSSIEYNIIANDALR